MEHTVHSPRARSSVSFASAVAAATVLFSGCTNLKYTVHIDATLKDAKIPASTIAVLPIDGLMYQPPSSCFGSSHTAEDEKRYQDHWNERMQKILMEKFPNQKWVFPSADIKGPDSGAIDFAAIREHSRKSAKAITINAMSADQIGYEPLPVNPELRPHLQKLRESTGAAYAVVFVAPSLSGSIQTTTTYQTYGTPGNTYGMWSTNSQTYYTADIRILVWECGSGKLLYSSGGWSKNTSVCFFVGAEDAAIDGADKDLRKKLQKIISYLIEYDVSRHGGQARR
jgi:hypothetical protein